MKTSIAYRRKVAKAAMAIPELAPALKSWHRHQAGGKGFDDWLAGIVGHLAEQVRPGYMDEPPVEETVAAIKINAMGIQSVWETAARDEKSFDCETDVNTYVEEGVVYVSVWYCGKLAYAAAESTKDFFEANGYAVDVWKDEETDDEYTVNANIDFDTFFRGVAR